MHLDRSGPAEAEFSGLNSAKSTRRLEKIAGLKARGIGDYIDLLVYWSCKTAVADVTQEQSETNILSENRIRLVI